MLITESQMSVGRQTNVLGLLDNMSYLTEAESVYAPAMVPVVENSRLDSRLIDIEDLTTFAESNGIEDLGYALTLVCEASQIDPSTVAFTVDKSTLIEDASLAELTANILSEGVNVVVKPLSLYTPVAILGEACLDYLYNTGDLSLLEAFVNDSLLEALTPHQQSLFGDYKRTHPELAGALEGLRTGLGKQGDKKFTDAEVKSMIQRKINTGLTGVDKNRTAAKGVATGQGNSISAAGQARLDAYKRNAYNGETIDGVTAEQIKNANMGKFPTSRSAAENIASNLKDVINKNQEINTSVNNQPSSNGSENTDGEVKKVAETMKEVENKAKTEWASKPRKWIADKIAWLHDKAQEFNQKVHTDGKNAPWYKKILSYITRAIAFLTKRLHNVVADKDHQIGDSKDGNFAYSSFYKKNN